MRSLQLTAILALTCLFAASAIAPAEARVRDSAAKTQSQNNLKQLGTAAQAAGECSNNLKQLGLGATAAKNECSSNLRQLHAQPRASRRDLNRLRKIRPQPAVPCGKVEYIYSCISGQTMFLKSAGCRRGETEASCCQRARTSVNKSCGRLWALARKSGKIWSPGIFTCKCTQTAQSKRNKLEPRERKMRRYPPDPIRPR